MKPQRACSGTKPPAYAERADPHAPRRDRLQQGCCRRASRHGSTAGPARGLRMRATLHVNAPNPTPPRRMRAAAQRLSVLRAPQKPPAYGERADPHAPRRDRLQQGCCRRASRDGSTAGPGSGFADARHAPRSTSTHQTRRPHGGCAPLRGVYPPYWNLRSTPGKRMCPGIKALSAAHRGIPAPHSAGPAVHGSRGCGCGRRVATPVRRACCRPRPARRRQSAAVRRRGR